LSFEIYHPKNNVHNQDGNHDDNKVRTTFFFFELTDNDGQNFVAGIVRQHWDTQVILNVVTFSVTNMSISSIYSERQKYGINSLKIKQNFFQKNLWTGRF
jgi:hypothetical protein